MRQLGRLTKVENRPYILNFAVESEKIGDKNRTRYPYILKRVNNEIAMGAKDAPTENVQMAIPFRVIVN